MVNHLCKGYLYLPSNVNKNEILFFLIINIFKQKIIIIYKILEFLGL